MSGPKQREANSATLSLIHELALPVNRGAFYVAVIDFSDDARWAHLMCPATELDGRVTPMDVGGNTNITAALSLALQGVKQQAVNDQDSGPLRPVALTLSDGAHNTGPSPEGVAEQLKAFVDHVTVGFGRDADEEMLKTLATSPQHFYRIRDSGAELRRFLSAVGKTLTQTLAQHTNATAALTQLQKP